MMNRRTFALPVGVATVILALVSPAHAVDMWSSITVPFDRIVFGDCSLEEVHLVGTESVKAHVVTDSQGRDHLKISGLIDVEGTGLDSGAQYSGRQSFEEHFDPDISDYPMTFTFTLNHLLIGHGAIENQTLHQTTHLTINANGDLTALVQTINTSCHPPN